MIKKLVDNVQREMLFFTSDEVCLNPKILSHHDAPYFLANACQALFSRQIPLFQRHDSRLIRFSGFWSDKQ